jgi:hypothetical protein
MNCRMKKSSAPCWPLKIFRNRNLSDLIKSRQEKYIFLDGFSFFSQTDGQ